MKDFCSISKLLERYFDDQATEEQKAMVEDHLPACPVCQERLKGLRGLREAIKIPVEKALKEETFPWVWEKIERGIQLRKKPSWRESLRFWLEISPWLRKRIWIPATAVAILLVLATSPFLFKKTSSHLEGSDVKYVKSEVYNVMVYESEKAEVTVIWLFEETQNESTAS